MEKPSVLQQEWDKLLDKLQIHLEQKQYHLLSVELKLAAAILQQEVSSEVLATLSEATIGLVKNCLIAVGQAANEKDYRDQFHKTLLNQWQKILINKNAGITETFLKEIRHKAPSSIMVKPHYHFNHDFNALYVANSSANPYQFLKSEQEDRLKRLEGDFERNRYVVYAEMVVTYVRCLIRARQVFTAEHLVALGSFIESLGLIASMQALGHEELWHYVLPLQNDLADELIYAHYQSFMNPAHLLDWQQKQPHKTGESLLILQTIVHTLNLNKALSASALVNWLQALNLFTDTWVAHQPQKLTCKLLLAEQHRQASVDYRHVFSANEASFHKIQKIFSAHSLGFLHKLTEQMAHLLGEKPCEWALCAMGSSARSDRRPYSDVELMLLYQTKPNVSESHLQTYLYFLLNGLEIAIKQLGETHCEYTQQIPAHVASDTTGFHLDSSCHILRWELFGTPQIILGKYFYNTLARIKEPEEAHRLDWHDWLHNRKFYALLLPKLIIGNSNLFKLYLDEVTHFLQQEVNEADQLEKLAHVLTLPQLSITKQPRHQVIALSCLMQVLQETQPQLTALQAGAVVNLKDTFYKPLTYLALNLKLYYGLKAEHPAEIFAEAAAQLPWGAQEVITLLQAALNYVGQLQAKLHLESGYQEESCVWLNQQVEEGKISLTAQEYAGLSLITDSLLLPLCRYITEHLKDSTNTCSLLDVLPYLLKSYLAARNESWLHRWAQHASHPLSLSELLIHPLIQVLADYPSPNGWSPTYEQALCRWLQQLQTLLSTEQSPCIIEGIPTSNKQKTSYLPAEIVTQLFDPQGEFKGNVHDSKQSKVSRISWPAPEQANSKTFYFKVKPGNEAGLMGREFAVIDLHQLLGGSSHIAVGWPLKLTYLSAKGPKVYYCWVSEGIPGKSLAQVMQAETDFVHFQAQLDRQSYSHLFITHYLTCPEDAQPDNFKVFQPSDKTKQILYGLDVGQSFVGTYDEKRKVLSVKTMLYLLEPAIHQALDTGVLTRLLLLDPQALIKHWQANLKQMNRLFQSLFEAELAKTRVPKAQWSLHNLLVDLNEAVHLSVQKRLELLLNWLYSYPQKEKSGAMLLKALEPAVALSYQSLRGKIKTPEDFYTIDPKAYVRNPNTGKMYSSTTYQQIQQQTLTPERLQASLALGEAYFATIDFRKITAEQEQHYVLALLQAAIQNKQRFTYLNLAGCTILNEKELIELLQKTTDLKELHLEDCPQFNLSTVLNIFSCKVNEKVISYLPLRWNYEVLCPPLRKLSIMLGGNVHLLEIALTLIGRKQLVTFINQQQQSVENYLKRLLVMLVKEDSFVRAAAARSIGKLATQLSPVQVERVVKALLALLTDNYSHVRAAAAQSLVQLAGQLSPVQVESVVQALLDGLSDKNVYVRAAAARSLVQLAGQLSPVQVELVVNALRDRLGAENWEVRAAAAQSLGPLAGQLSPVQVESVMKALLFRLSDKDSDVRAAAAQSLGQLATQLSLVQVESVMKALLDRLGDEDWYDGRAAAAQSLGPLAAQLSPVQVELVMNALRDRLGAENWEVRAAAAQSLGPLAGQLSPMQVELVVNALRDRLGDKNWEVRAAAAQSLGPLAGQLSPVQLELVVNALRDRLRDLDHDVRAAAAQSLGQLAGQLSPVQVERVVNALRDGLSDKDGDVRAAAARSLVQLAGQLSPVQVVTVVQALLDGLSDKDGDVRAAAVQSLGQLAAQLSPVQVVSVVKALLDRLGAENWEMRGAAAQSLGPLAGQLSPVQVELVVKALLDWLCDEGWYVVREAATRSLGQLAGQLSPVQVERVVKALRDRLRDRDSDVRIAAVNSLAEIFSVITSLQWLQKNMLQIEQAAFKSPLESSMQTDQTILYKLFSYLDQKTLFEVVPHVNKDWQRWQKVYLHQQAQKMREQNFIFLEETPNKAVMDFHTRFLYSQSVNHTNVQKDATFVNTNAKNAIQTNPTTTLGVISKPIHLAQTNFFQLEKNMQVTVPKHYTVQLNQQAVVFEVKTVAGDGDCGYTAFGITRAWAYQLLVNHLEKIHPLIKSAVQEALRAQAFIDTLQREGRLTEALSNAYKDYINASHGGAMPQQVLDTLDSAGKDLTILRAYIDYDVKAKQIDAGWSHPCILFALAEIQGIELHIWQCNEQEELVPYVHYPQHIPAQVNTRTDLLFINNNHFERLELIDNDVQLAAQPSNTNAL